jgi:hypothetical protein
MTCVCCRYVVLFSMLAVHLLPAWSQEPDHPPALPLPQEEEGDQGIAYRSEPDYPWAGEGTGISGVYEVIIGVRDLDYAMQYFREFGFRLNATGFLTRFAAETVYGIPSAVKSYRLQNGNTDSHGLIRLMVWENPSGPGVGYAEPGTIGSRMMGMLTHDVHYLHDIYVSARRADEPWLVSPPVVQYPLGDPGGGFFERPILSREIAVYGDWCNHLFYQRNGYTVPGYGQIHHSTRLGTSEITNHDFFIRIDSLEQLHYLRTVLGLEADGEPSINGDWLDAPRELYHLKPGETYLFQSWQSPNNVCGKIRYFIPSGDKPDRSSRQSLGREGITGHTFYTPYMERLWLKAQEEGLSPGPVGPNEFGERSFVFRGPEGATWQIIERTRPPTNEPIPFLHLQVLDK